MSPSPTDWATSDRFCLSDDIRSIPRGSFRDLRQPHIRLTHQCGIGVIPVHAFQGKLGVDISVGSGYTVIVKRTTSTALLLDGRYGAFLFSTSEYAFSENLALTFPLEVDILLVEAFPR